MNHYYMGSVGSPDATQRMMDRDRDRHVDYKVHYHKEGEECTAICEVFTNE